MQITIDLTPYCYRLYEVHGRRLRLVVYCAPGLEDELKERLARSLKVSPTRHAKGSLRFDRPDDIDRMVTAIEGKSPLSDTVSAWASTWTRCRRGQPVSEDTRNEQMALVKRALRELAC